MKNSIPLIVQCSLVLSISLLLAINIGIVSCSLTLPLIFSNSPESPLHVKNLTQQQRIEQLVHQTQDRTRCISSSQKSSNSAQPERATRQELCIKYTALLLKIGIGTFQTPIPHKTYYMLVDSGSDLIWLQCEDCQVPPNKCFPSPPYPKTRSITYLQIPCGTHELCYTKKCESGDCPYECTNGFCSYHFSYADNTKIQGYMALEKFTLGISDRQNDLTQDNVFNLVFGCNYFFSGDPIPTGEMGMLGLGWGPRSFISQVKTQFDDVFSYCIPHYSETVSGGRGYLTFGLDDDFDPRHFSTVALRRFPSNHDESYYLNLNGISVFGRRLELDPSIFVRKGRYGGTVIDSGTALSVLTSEAYEELKKVLIAYFESQGYARTNPGQLEFQFDLCFKELGHKLDEFPSITLNFEGADLLIEPNNVYMWLDDPPNSFCLTIMASEDGDSLIGAYQQSDYHFIFDRRNFLMHFRPQKDCGLVQ